jgi:hypothetical protein
MLYFYDMPRYGLDVIIIIFLTSWYNAVRDNIMVQYYWHEYGVIIWDTIFKKNKVIHEKEFLIQEYKGKIGIKNIHNIEPEFYDFW